MGKASLAERMRLSPLSAEQPSAVLAHDLQPSSNGTPTASGDCL
jgi:hypothetical protein